MKLPQKIALGLLVAAAAIFAVYISGERTKTKRMLSQIADEGYETAQDVLFPGKTIQDKKLHFGPVIPE